MFCLDKWTCQGLLHRQERVFLHRTLLATVLDTILELHAAFVRAMLVGAIILSLPCTWPWRASMLANMLPAAHLILVVISVSVVRILSILEAHFMLSCDRTNVY
jgi:uncharacterized membrane protein